MLNRFVGRMGVAGEYQRRGDERGRRGANLVMVIKLNSYIGGGPRLAAHRAFNLGDRELALDYGNITNP